MKHMIAVFMAIALMNTAAWAHECPRPTVQIKGPCPSPCVPCPDCKLECPDPADCICKPTPSVVIPGPLEVRTETITRVIPSSIPQSGKWALLPGLMWVAGWETDISYYEQRYDDPEDPALRLTLDEMVLASLDVEYVSPKGWGFQIGPFVALDKPDLGIEWTDRPHYTDVSRLEIDEPDRPWGLAARVRIPLGR